MLVIKIGEKDYRFEFTVEASLYNEVTEKVTELMVNLNEAGDTENVKQMLKSLADVPKTALTMFYAGLLEHHSSEIRSIDDAKGLIKQYFKENADESFYSVMEQMIACMSDDGFFRQIGLEQMLSAPTEENVTKIPQDHKKKTTTTTKKATSK